MENSASSKPHRIDSIPDAMVVWAHPYWAGPKARDIEDLEVKQMPHAGVIERVQWEWASPVVPVPKPDGSLRFCVDHRRCNTLIIEETYLLLHRDDFLDSLGSAQLLTTLECNSSYWQLPIDPKDRNKTTFTYHFGAYMFTRMPFSLCTASATFQRIVDILS